MMSVKKHFTCSITQETLVDPVATCDGHIYEREAIRKWFATGKRTSPETGQVLYTAVTTPLPRLKAFLNEANEQTKPKKKYRSMTHCWNAEALNKLTVIKYSDYLKTKPLDMLPIYEHVKKLYDQSNAEYRLALQLL